MRWTSPPDRREVTLILFSIAVYILSYNLDTSLHLLGLDPVVSHAGILSRLGIGGPSAIGKDGRKPHGWRDQLENKIFGDWAWDVGHVAGDGAERSQEKGLDRYGAMWMGRAETGTVAGKVFGETTANDMMDFWDSPPTATILKHTAGFTVVDNAILFNGTVYLVVDDINSTPSIQTIVMSKRPGEEVLWRIVSMEQATELLPHYSGRIDGVTWIATDLTGHNSTLMALWRMYSSLDPEIDSLGQTVLPPPRRIFFPNVNMFSDPNPDTREDPRRRIRADSGFHPYLQKIAFPTLGLMYQDDWLDYQKMEVPFVIKRAVIADRQAAAATSIAGDNIFAGCFAIKGSDHWWEPVRRPVMQFFDVPDEEKSKKTVVTYLHRQQGSSGPRVRDEDHDALVAALRKLGRGFEVHIISSLDREMNWDKRMEIVVKSTVILGVFGDNLLDSVFMKPSPHTTLIEFFPDQIFFRDNQLPAQALGIDYMAWWNNKKAEGSLLENAAKLTSLINTGTLADQAVPVNAQAIVNVIRDSISR